MSLHSVLVVAVASCFSIVSSQASAQQFNSQPLPTLGVATSSDNSVDIRFSAEFVTRRVTEQEFQEIRKTGWQLVSYDELPLQQKAVMTWRDVIAFREPNLNDIFTNGHEVQLGPERSRTIPLLNDIEKRNRCQWIDLRLESLRQDLRTQHEKLMQLRSSSATVQGGPSSSGTENIASAERGLLALIQLQTEYQIERVVIGSIVTAVNN